MRLQTISRIVVEFMGLRRARLLLVFFVAFPPQQALADCEGGPVFQETIYAQDKNAFAWQTPMDVEFLKGDLAQLKRYTAWLRGSLTSSNVLDMSSDNVGPGYGVYYLVKSGGTPCGSWQSETAAEPLRDTSIAPSCTGFPITEEMMDAAAAIAFAAAPRPWSDANDAQLYFRIMQEELGCVLELPQEGAEDSRTTSDYDPNDPYDPNEVYCGINFLQDVPGFSHGPIVGQLYSSQCMNMKCFNHDYDYFTNCVGGICAFSIQTPVWDALLEEGCHNAPAGCLQLTNPFYAWDLFVCGYIKAAVWSPINDPLCFFAPCSSPGAACCSMTSECVYEAPVSRWSGDGDASDAVGANHGTLVGDTSFAPGVLGQAFNFDGSGDYVEFGDVLDEITIPFSVEGWIKTPGSPGGDQGWLGLFASDDSSYLENYHGIWLQLDPDNRLYISYGDGSGNAGGARRTKGTTGPIPLNTWIHIATVVRGPVDMTIYINGNDVGGQYSGSGGAMDHTTHPARLGANISWAPFWGLENWPFAGEIDEFAIYNRELSQKEILAIVTHGHEEICSAQ